MFHPIFLSVALLIILTIYQVLRSSKPALNSSIKESDEKYRLFDIIASEEHLKDSDLKCFLSARDFHFKFIRRNSFKVSALLFVVQAVLLSVGCYLIKINQLSVGQLVSAEIIISGIFVPLSKLPLTLEAVYDYETSKFKIGKAMGEK
jgi:putative ABC transport system ATP-binding protein